MRAATSRRRRGCGGIQSFRRILRAAAPTAAILALTLALAAPAAAAPSPTGGGVKVDQGPKPQLLLFHGGSFLFEDPLFESATVEAALAAGFVPHYVNYPLADMPQAVLRARAEAQRLRQRFGADRVFAYGFSAGGTLAALLSGEGLVSAAVAKSPPTDLVSWSWPQGRYGIDFYDQIDLDPEARYRLSPVRRPQREPLLILQGRGDMVVPASMNEAFAAKFPRVHLWLVAGGHTTERVRPWLVPRSMNWLARIAEQEARADARREEEAARN